MAKTFIQVFEEALQAKNSILCIGLDPALPQQRKHNVIPSKYLDKENEARLNFCLDLLDETADFCVAAKPNEQYLRGFTTNNHKKLTDSIRKHGLLSIYDCKLGDIRDTAESALFYYHKWGYDGITFNPFPGNIGEVVGIAHSYDPQIGIIVLTLMSNPEAETFMKHATIARTPVYLKIAADVKEYGADGCVVGATGHVTEKDLISIRQRVGTDKVLLIPGIGAQKGDPEKVVKTGGQNILINVGRDIIYSDNPRKKAEEYCRLFNAIRNKYKRKR
jgi:orotidine 5'-phosphate decarboxylase subfamily 2